MKQPPLAHGRAHYLRAWIGYTLLSALMLGPALAHSADGIPGGPIAAVDGYQNVWNLWWVREALARGQNPFFSDLIFYPDGAPLYVQTLNISNGLLALPFTALWGPVAGYYLAAILAFGLCGLGGYALALRESGSRAAALVGGAIFTFAPFHVAKLWDGQLELVAAQWLAFYALFLLRALERGRRGDIALAGLSLALVAYTSLYYSLFAAILSALVVLLWWPRQRWGRHLARAAGAAGLAALLLAPLAVLAARDGVGQVQPIAPAEVIERSANLLDFVLPSYLHPLWGPVVGQAFGNGWNRSSADWDAALGYTALALAGLGLATAWRQAWRWLALALAAALLALGPALKVGPATTAVPLPYALISSLPGLSLGRRPFLFTVLIILALAPLSALGLRWLLQRVGPRRWPLALAAVAALLLAEYIPRPWPIQPAAVHPYYQQLRQGEGAILEIPPAVYKNVRPQQAQIVHGRPIFGGYLARAPIYPLVDQAAVLRELWAAGLGDAVDPAPALIAPLDPTAALRSYGVGDIVVHWDRLAPAEAAAVRAALGRALPGLAPSFADDTLSVYRLPAGPRAPLAYFGTDWYPQERDGARSWRWMGAAATIEALNPTAEGAALQLSLRGESFATARELTVELDGAPIGSWRVQPAATAINLYALIPPGSHRLTLRATASPEGASGRALSVVIYAASGRWAPPRGQQ